MEALDERDPTTPDDVLSLLLLARREAGAQTVLEIGTGRGLTTIAFLLDGAQRVTTIEREEERLHVARENFTRFGVSGRVTLIEGEAADVLPCLEQPFDLIFLDCAKVQYRRFLPACKRLLREGGVLCADDVLLFSDGVPKKRRMLAQHIEEFLQALQADEDFQTTVYPAGKGLAVAVKRTKAGQRAQKEAE